MKYFLKIFTICLLLGSCQKLERDTIVFDDFEKGTYDKWNIQGHSFKKPIHKDTLPQNVKNIKGKYLAYSIFDTDSLSWDQGKNQGKLVSNPFTINRDYINFSIAGGTFPTRNCMNLIIDNKIVRFETGRMDYVLRPVSWDVTAFEGKTAIIEIVDAMGSSKDVSGYTLVDHIVFTDKKLKKELVFEDFESGTYNNWQVEGDAFEMPRNRTNVYYPISATGFNGKYFAFSFGDTHDRKLGKLKSAHFNIKNDYLNFLIGGGNHPGKTCLNLIINDSIVFSETGKNDGQMRSYQWNLKPYKDKTARLEIVDAVSGSWGHIMVDDLIFEDDKPYYATMEYWGIIGIILIFIGIVLAKLLRSKNNPKPYLETNDDIVSLQQVLAQIKESRIHRNSDASINDVMQIVTFEKNEIHQLFEASTYKSVNNYLNYLRVEDFKEQLKDPANKAFTMISLAEKAGFSSKTSFYRIFKQVTNMTPSDYKKQL